MRNRVIEPLQRVFHLAKVPANGRPFAACHASSSLSIVLSFCWKITPQCDSFLTYMTISLIRMAGVKSPRKGGFHALRCRFRVLRRRLGIERDRRGETIVPYSFRHTGATIAAASGVRDRILADVLGHIETKTIARYQHLQRGHLVDAMRKVCCQDAQNQSKY